MRHMHPLVHRPTKIAVWAGSLGLLLFVALEIVGSFHFSCFTLIGTPKGQNAEGRNVVTRIPGVTGSKGPEQPYEGPACLWGPSCTACTATFIACLLWRAAPRRLQSRHFQTRHICKSKHDKDSGVIGDESLSSNTGSTGSEAEEVAKERCMEELEEKLDEMVQAQDYTAAAAIRDKLHEAQIDDEAHVLRANAEFYEAFSARDLERMKSTWLPANHVQCIHPYDTKSTGFNNVCSYWRRMFDAASSSRNRITAEDVRIHVSGATATVVCTEQVTSKSTKQPPYRSMIATNIFRKVKSRWLMVHRHVSPVIQATQLLGENVVVDDSMRKFTEMARLLQMNLSEVQHNLAMFAKLINRDTEKRYDDSNDEFLEQVIGSMHPSVSGEFTSLSALHDEDDGDDDEDDDEDSDLDDLENDQEMLMREQVAKEATRDTWRAVRQLRDQGRLSGEEAIKLLSDIIRTPGQSMPEKAHDLLLTGVSEEEEETAWDDFAQLVVMEAKSMRVDSGSASGKPASESAKAGEWKGST